MAFNPTKAQQQAIDTMGNVLVSAAAGSGKTAVLVERVIKKLCNTKDPIRADELLIVTFTNAAAAEMRMRIEKRLDEECALHPNDTALLLQKHLLNNAKICTIDSFCIDLVRENFDKLGIEPDFKIGDNTDMRLIGEEVLYSIINRYFEEKDPRFFALLDIIGAEYDEQNFVNLLFEVYDFSRQLPFPKKWYSEILNNYNCQEFAKNPWHKYAFQKAQNIISSMESVIDNSIELISTVKKAYDSFYSCFCDAKDKILILKEKANLRDWDTFYNALNEFSLLKLPIVRGLNDYSQICAAKENYKFLSGKALDSVYKFFYNDSSFITNQFEKLYPSIELFFNILNEFEDKVFETYKEKNIFTFHITEHLALDLLCKEEEGTITVSDNGTELLEQYKEVMVDEYQDTNDLQDMLFYILSNYEKKLFVVGDVKQSIYAFRGANPANFINKKQNYLPLEKAQENDAKKIILGNNFRSRSEICDFINYFFGLFMQESTGKIVYNEEEMLIPAANFPKLTSPSVSFNLIDGAKKTNDALIFEARSIADFIKETMNGEACVRSADDTLRKAKYGDFAILLRNVNNKAPAIVAELEALGIPVNLSINNFAESVEISTFLSLLKVIDNPKNDIALATILMSPVFGFSADELAEIRIQKRNGNLYSALLFASNNNNLHAAQFLSKLEKFRLKSVTTPLSKLIMQLLIETEYLNIVSSMPDGEQRRNNLLLLCDLATSFVSENTRSLTAFADYILNLSSVGAVSGDSNAVKIMSIHASKGLQFPICIVATTSARFSDEDSRNAAAYSTKYGLGLKYYDENAKEKYTTLSREVILDDLKSSALEEELRLIYVAMTRAQDKLHFISSFSNLEKTIQSYKDLLIISQSKIDYNLFKATNSYSDWLMISLLLNSNCNMLRDCDDCIIPVDTNSCVEVRIIDSATLAAKSSDNETVEIKINDKLKDEMCANFSYKYPYNDILEIQSKLSVSRLTNKAESDKYAFTAKPSFMSKDGVTATGRGTAMHKVIEFFDFTKTDFIEEEIDRLYEWQFITEAERDSLDIKALKTFFDSDIFNRIIKADRVEREMRFLTEIPACEINKDLDEHLKNEKIIVQGAVDICFIEKGNLVILDFKTDRVGDIEELATSYGEQLSVYAKACEKIFGMKVSEKIIYSFTKSDTVMVK